MHSQQPSLLRKNRKYINSHEFEKVCVPTFQFLPAARKQDVTFSESPFVIRIHRIIQSLRYYIIYKYTTPN